MWTTIWIILVVVLLIFIGLLWVCNSYWNKSDAEMKERLDAIFKKKGKIISGVLIIGFMLGIYDTFPNNFDDDQSL